MVNSKMKKLLLLNGPNLNMLGIREPGIYGNDTLASIERDVVEYGQSHGADVDCFQSNHEGALIDRIHDAHGKYDAIIYNPGAHTHYSWALHDAIASIDVPMIEVHISDVDGREEWRHFSVFEDVRAHQIKGHGTHGYVEAVDVALAM